MCRSCSTVDSTPSSVMFTFTNMNWSQTPDGFKTHMDVNMHWEYMLTPTILAVAAVYMALWAFNSLLGVELRNRWTSLE